ncbi:MAG TPA: YlxR family protein [Actinopolymorphaceae bacterium]|nr:YlxR family protein [Actinopolymorphaceae bacterium]
MSRRVGQTISAGWVHSPKVGRTGREPKTRPHVVRTCVGCRHRAAKSELLRVVLVRDDKTAWLLPDVSGRASGRGAHLHPTAECLELAERRRAFPRALRAEGPVGLEALRRHVGALDGTGAYGRPPTTLPAAPRRCDMHDLCGSARNADAALRQESGSSGS